MQPNSIHNPDDVEHAPSQNLTPTSGDNFTFVSSLNGVPDPMALLEAIDFLDNYVVALAAFEQEMRRTGTV